MLAFLTNSAIETSMRFSPVWTGVFGLSAGLGLVCCWPISSAAAADPNSTGTVRVAGIVLKWVRTDKEANFRRVEPMIREAATNRARIVCTTECFLDGYAIADKSIPLEKYRALGEPIPDGEYYQRLAALAAELKIHLIAGMTEAAGDARYNTSVLIGPDGKLAGKYRKQKLEHELGRNTPGNASPVFETPFGKVGIMICADRTEPSIVESICTRGADFLICPSGGMFGSKKNDPIVQERSRENKIHIVFVHPAEFLVTGPDGAILSQTVLADRLLITPEQKGGTHDQNRVFYFDVPMVRRSADHP
jgi:predicted amidohydrolase